MAGVTAGKGSAQHRGWSDATCGNYHGQQGDRRKHVAQHWSTPLPERSPNTVKRWARAAAQMVAVCDRARELHHLYIHTILTILTKASVADAAADPQAVGIPNPGTQLRKQPITLSGGQLTGQQAEQARLAAASNPKPPARIHAETTTERTYQRRERVDATMHIMQSLRMRRTRGNTDTQRNGQKQAGGRTCSSRRKTSSACSREVEQGNGKGRVGMASGSTRARSTARERGTRRRSHPQQPSTRSDQAAENTSAAGSRQDKPHVKWRSRERRSEYRPPDDANTSTTADAGRSTERALVNLPRQLARR